MDELKNNTNVNILSKITGKLHKSCIAEINENAKMDGSIKQSVKKMETSEDITIGDLIAYIEENF